MTRARVPAPPAEDVAIARKILAENAGVIGAFPAPPLRGRQGVTWPVLVRLGRALRLLVGKPIGLVRAPQQRPSAGAPPATAEAPYRLRELDDWQLVELILPPSRGLGEAAEHLERALRAAVGNFAHVIVDLDGYVPDVPEVLPLTDAFVSVALAGGTRDRELLATVELLPTARHLGTLLLEQDEPEHRGVR
jgi:hypothetical protein